MYLPIKHIDPVLISKTKYGRCSNNDTSRPRSHADVVYTISRKNDIAKNN